MDLTFPEQTSRVRAQPGVALDDDPGPGRPGISAAFRHDLRQPLGAVGVVADAIVSTCDLPPEALVGLRLIQRQTAWMSRLLDSSVDHTPVAVVDLGDTVAEPCSLAPVRSPFEVHFDKLDEAPVLVDPVGLERVARNLMDNATRAVFDGGQVEVRVRAEEQDALLEVADSGPGFGHLAPHQGHGLVGVRRFVDRFGGGLSCGTSWLGGALVTLRLPIAVGW